MLSYIKFHRLIGGILRSRSQEAKVTLDMASRPGRYIVQILIVMAYRVFTDGYYSTAYQSSIRVHGANYIVREAAVSSV